MPCDLCQESALDACSKMQTNLHCQKDCLEDRLHGTCWKAQAEEMMLMWLAMAVMQDTCDSNAAKSQPPFWK